MADDFQDRLNRMTGARIAGCLSSGSLAPDNERLQAHLRNTVANQLAVDQPNYPGLESALSPA